MEETDDGVCVALQEEEAVGGVDVAVVGEPRRQADGERKFGEERIDRGRR